MKRSSPLAAIAVGLFVFQLALADAGLVRGNAGTGADDLVGCGEVCGRLLAGYHGCSFTRDDLQRFLQPGEIGETSLAKLAAALRSRGLDARVVKGTMPLLAQWHAPAILLVTASPDEPIGHFVVAKWDAGEEPLVFDAFARQEPFHVAPATLERHWTGFALLVYEPRSWGMMLTAACSVGGVAVGLAIGSMWLSRMVASAPNRADPP